MVAATRRPGPNVASSAQQSDPTQGSTSGAIDRAAIAAVAGTTETTRGGAEVTMAAPVAQPGAGVATVASRPEPSTPLGAGFDEMITTAEATSLGDRAVRDPANQGSMPMPNLSIDLSDEGLGPLTLHAVTGTGGLHLRLTAGDRAVGEALARAGDELRRDLESEGTALGSLDIGHSNDRGADNSSGRAGWWTDRSRADRSLAERSQADAAAVVATTTRGRSGEASGLDLLI